MNTLAAAIPRSLAIWFFGKAIGESRTIWSLIADPPRRTFAPVPEFAPTLLLLLFSILLWTQAQRFAALLTKAQSEPSSAERFDRRDVYLMVSRSVGLFVAVSAIPLMGWVTSAFAVAKFNPNYSVSVDWMIVAAHVAALALAIYLVLAPERLVDLMVKRDLARSSRSNNLPHN